MNYKIRRNRLTELLQAKNIADFLITNLDNIFYLTGFKGTNAILLHKEGGQYLFITDPRYAGQAERLKSPDLPILIYQPGELEHLCKNLAKEVSVEDTLTVSELKKWEEKAPQSQFNPQGEIIESLRLCKDAEEIDRIRSSQHFVDEVLEKYFPTMIHKGITEKALAFQLEQTLLSEGSHHLSFPSIVAFSENSAIPHHQNSDRKLKPGDNILVDCGIVLQGYCSDITRNFSLGSPSAEYQNKYDLLLSAQEKALQKIKAGISMASLDTQCRKDLGDEAEAFSHSLGHGVGIEVHEPPRISSRSEDLLEENMIITIEPGLYYRGKFGIRIEDLVWVQREGCEILSQCPKELIIL